MGSRIRQNSGQPELWRVPLPPSIHAAGISSRADLVQGNSLMPTANGPLRGLPSEQWGQLEQILKDFEAAWQRGERPVLDDYLHRAPTGGSLGLIELAHVDLEYRLKAGDPAPLVEGYFARSPAWAEPKA